MSQNNTIPVQAVVRRMLRFTLLVAAIGFGLRAIVLSPIYIRFASDVAYADDWWVILLYYLTDGGLCDLTVFALCYPATLYAIWVAGFKRAVSVPVLYAILTVVKFILNFIMSCITDSALPQFSDFVSGDLPIILAMVLLELLQYALMILIMIIWRSRYENRVALAAAATELGRDMPPPLPAFPLRRLVDMKNPVQGTAFLTALILFIGRLAMHQIYQYALYITSGYTDGIVVMLVDLLLDIFISVLFYFSFLLLLPRFHEKNA